MTEAEWLACEEPVAMIRFVSNGTSHRKERLFATACCRNVDGLLCNDCRELLARVESAADHPPSSDAASELINDVARLSHRVDTPLGCARMHVASAIYCAADCDNAIGAAYSVAHAVYVARLDPGNFDANLAVSSYTFDPTELNAQAHLLRDIVGNPFRPVAFSPAWRTDTAMSLARGMYESRDFGAMPILADALQDAGCDNEDALNHCRADAGHVRGCWVVDLVLGKS